MENKGQYVAAGKRLWLDALRSPAPEVPLTFRSVKLDLMLRDDGEGAPAAKATAQGP